MFDNIDSEELREIKTGQEVVRMFSGYKEMSKEKNKSLSLHPDFIA